MALSPERISAMEFSFSIGLILQRTHMVMDQRPLTSGVSPFENGKVYPFAPEMVRSRPSRFDEKCVSPFMKESVYGADDD